VLQETQRTAIKPPLASIFLLSSAALSYEVLLVRLFSIIHWHHFAFMVISIALLGYGVSGSLITVFQRGLLQRYGAVIVFNAMMFGLSAITCFIAVQQMPFNALEILWDTSQWQRLFMSYLLLTLPFFFVANVIALTMARFGDRIARVYGVDLIGAGVGAMAILILLQFNAPETVLRMATSGSIWTTTLLMIVLKSIISGVKIISPASILDNEMMLSIIASR